MTTTYRPMNNIKLLSLKKEEKILLLIIHWKQKKIQKSMYRTWYLWLRK